jgi:thiamine monophosphate kinase
MKEIRRIWKPTATTDLSDGLARDLKKICRSSSVGARVDLENLPVSVECFLVCEERNQDPRTLAATGGEDYQLLFASNLPPEKSPTDAGGATVSPIGRIVQSPKRVEYRLCGRRVNLEGGFDHFSPRAVVAEIGDLGRAAISAR